MRLKEWHRIVRRKGYFDWLESLETAEPGAHD